MEQTASTMLNVNTTISDIKDRAADIRLRAEEGKEGSDEVKNRALQLKDKTQIAGDKTREMYEDVQKKTAEAMEQAKAVEKINQFTQAILDISSQTRHGQVRQARDLLWLPGKSDSLLPRPHPPSGTSMTSLRK